MEIIERPLQSLADLYTIGALVRRVARRDPHWNAWSFTRFDIWAQRRVADELVHERTAWRDNLHFWFAGNGPLLAAAGLDRAPNGFVVSDPDYPELLVPAVEWIEARCAALAIKDKPVGVEAVERNPALTGLLEGRGYHRSADYMNVRAKWLENTPREPVRLPGGYRLRHAAERQDLLHHINAVHQVFDMLDPEDVFRTVVQAPSYLPELNLLVMAPLEGTPGAAPGDECAAFATAWLDRGLGVGEFEPVGTVPAYQKLGLGEALLAEGCNRLRELGCREAHVESWSESPGANRLYEKAGFSIQDRLYNWEYSFSAGR